MDYNVAYTLAELEPLDNRREQICLKFDRKDFKKENSLFMKNEASVSTRNPRLVSEPKCNIKRVQKSSMPYLSKLFNQNP